VRFCNEPLAVIGQPLPPVVTVTFREQWNVIIYFKRARDIFGMKEQGTREGVKKTVLEPGTTYGV